MKMLASEIAFVLTLAAIVFWVLALRQPKQNPIVYSLDGKWLVIVEGGQTKVRAVDSTSRSYVYKVPPNHKGTPAWFQPNYKPDEVESTYLTDAFTREAVSFINRHSNQPFFWSGWYKISTSAEAFPFSALLNFSKSSCLGSCFFLTSSVFCSSSLVSLALFSVSRSATSLPVTKTAKPINTTPIWLKRYILSSVNTLIFVCVSVPAGLGTIALLLFFDHRHKRRLRSSATSRGECPHHL